jgi:hypothetical protein
VAEHSGRVSVYRQFGQTQQLQASLESAWSFVSIGIISQHVQKSLLGELPPGVPMRTTTAVGDLSPLGYSAIGTGTAGPHPFIDLRNLEFPKSADPMGW